MRSITDVFIRHPVLAIVVNLVIVLVGWRALSALPVQQYPQLESSSVVITTLYYGASAETVRGFLTTPIERAVSAIAGVDHVESTSRAGVSTVTVRLKLNHDSTAALAEVTARLQQVRSELPAEAEPPTVEVQRADRPYATFYLSFNFERAQRAGDHRLPRAQRAAAARDDRGRAARQQQRGRPPHRDARLDRPRPPRGAQPRARRRARRPAAQQLPRRRRPDQGQPGAGQPARQHRPALGRRVRQPHRRRARRRDRAAARRCAGRARRRGGEPGRASYNDMEGVYLGVWTVVGSNELEVAGAAARSDGAHSSRRCPRTSRCVSSGTARCSCATPSRRSPRPSSRRS